ncbi:MAG: transglycosylase SLT domain-containing protein [Myxococcaceae bacterium]
MRRVVGACAFVAMFATWPARAQAPSAGELDAGVERELGTLLQPFTGDWDAIQQRGVLRALVVYSRTYYFVDRGSERGLTYEVLKAFEDDVNKTLGAHGLRFTVLFIPVARDELIPALLDGRGDIAAAGLAITPDRLAMVDFSAPLATDVSEVVVTGPRSPQISRVEDLSGQSIHVRKSSSYWEHLEQLNQTFVHEGKPPAKLIPTSEELEDEDLLEMVNAGLFPIVVVDRFKARFWQQVFVKLKFEPLVTISNGDSIAWMLRKGNPQLKAVMDGFIRTHKLGTEFGNVLQQRYFKSARYVEEATSEAELRKFQATVDLFRKYAGKYDADYLLMMAQGYQESRLEQSAKSSVGAVGVMQLMPATGQQMQVGDITQLEPNIHAGVKYLKFVENTYFSDAAIDPLVRSLFAFASYNAGPNRIQELRREAQRRHLDPNRWFRNVELVVAEKVGQETVSYVANIYKYYIAYQLVAEQERERQAVKRQLEPQKP